MTDLYPPYAPLTDRPVSERPNAAFTVIDPAPTFAQLAVADSVTSFFPRLVQRIELVPAGPRHLGLDMWIDEEGRYESTIVRDDGSREAIFNFQATLIWLTYLKLEHGVHADIDMGMVSIAGRAVLAASTIAGETRPLSGSAASEILKIPHFGVCALHERPLPTVHPVTDYPIRWSMP